MCLTVRSTSSVTKRQTYAEVWSRRGRTACGSSEAARWRAGKPVAVKLKANGKRREPILMHCTTPTWCSSPLHRASTSTRYCESVRLEGRQERLRLLNTDDQARPPDGGLVLSGEFASLVLLSRQRRRTVPFLLRKGSYRPRGRSHPAGAGPFAVSADRAALPPQLLPAELLRGA